MATLRERLDPQILAQINAKQSAYPDLVIPESTLGVKREDRTIPGLENAPSVRVRIYQSDERTDDPTPAFLFFHWGGFTGGSYEDYAGFLERIVKETGAVVASVDYRLAPEHPFPAAPNDCYAALQWLASPENELNINLERIAVGGISAGGCLAAAIALIARDKGGPKLCFQFLLIPNTDDRIATPSTQEITDPLVFNRQGNQEAWEAYLGDSKDDVSPYAAPARATDLSGLPPAYVYVEQLDPLRDEGIRYAHRLMQAGVDTELHVSPGTYHGSFVFCPETDIGKRVVSEHLSTLKRVLNPK